MELFSLVGKIALDGMDTFNKDMDDASSKSESFASKLGKGAKTVAGVGTAIVGATAGIVTGLTSFAESSASTADNVDKMSQKIGVSREAYQELDFICSQSGASVDGLQAGMKTLTTVMDTTAKGTSKSATALEELGISATDSEGNLRNSEDVMWEAFEALQGMENQSEKARLAVKLFGKSGTELMPLLNGASGSIDEMKQQAHDLGLVLSDELIDNGVEMTDSLDQTKRAFSAIATNLGGALMPIVTKASDYIQKFMPQIQAFIERLTPIITGLFDSLLPPLMEMAEKLFPEIMNLIEELLPSLSEIFSQVLPIITQFLQLLMPIFVKLAQMVLPVLVDIISAFLPILQPIFKILEPILNLILLLLTPLLKLIDLVLPLLLKGIELMLGRLAQIPDDFKKWVNDCKIIFNFFKKATIEIFNKIKEKIIEIWNNIKEKVVAVVTNIKEKVIKVWTSIKEKATTIFNGVKTVVTTVFNAIKTFFTNVWENIKTDFASKVDAIKTTATTVFNAVKTKVTSIFTKVKDAITTPISDAKETLEGVLENIKSAFTDKLTTAKNKVKEIIDKIKGFFSFKVDLPDVKLPHFKIDPDGWQFTDLLQGKMPNLDVEWYAKAMSSPMIMNSPTAFGINKNGQIMAGGEKGSEVVSGTSTLMNMISSAVGTQIAGIKSAFTDMASKIMSFLEQFTGIMPMLQSMTDTMSKILSKTNKDKNVAVAIQGLLTGTIAQRLFAIEEVVRNMIYQMLSGIKQEVHGIKKQVKADNNAGVNALDKAIADGTLGAGNGSVLIARTILSSLAPTILGVQNSTKKSASTLETIVPILQSLSDNVSKIKSKESKDKKATLAIQTFLNDSLLPKLESIEDMVKTSVVKILTGIKTTIQNLKKTADSILSTLTIKANQSATANKAEATASSSIQTSQSATARTSEATASSSIQTTASTQSNSTQSIVEGIAQRMMSVLSQIAPTLQSMSDTLLLIKRKERKDKNATLEIREIMGSVVAPKIGEIEDALNGNVFHALDDMKQEMQGLKELIVELATSNHQMQSIQANILGMLPQLAETQIVLDSGALVGQIAPRMDSALGRLAVRNGRGV